MYRWPFSSGGATRALHEPAIHAVLRHHPVPRLKRFAIFDKRGAGPLVHGDVIRVDESAGHFRARPADQRRCLDAEIAFDAGTYVVDGAPLVQAYAVDDTFDAADQRFETRLARGEIVDRAFQRRDIARDAPIADEAAALVMARDAGRGDPHDRASRQAVGKVEILERNAIFDRVPEPRHMIPVTAIDADAVGDGKADEPFRRDAQHRRAVRDIGDAELIVGLPHPVGGRMGEIAKARRTLVRRRGRAAQGRFGHVRAQPESAHATDGAVRPNRHRGGPQRGGDSGEDEVGRLLTSGERKRARDRHEDRCDAHGRGTHRRADGREPERDHRQIDRLPYIARRMQVDRDVQGNGNIRCADQQFQTPKRCPATAHGAAHDQQGDACRTR